MTPSTTRSATLSSPATVVPMMKRKSKKVDRLQAAPVRNDAQLKTARRRTDQYRLKKRATRAEVKKQVIEKVLAEYPVQNQKGYLDDDCDIIGHFYDMIPTVFEVLIPTGETDWISEVSLADSLIPCLRDYQGRVSGVEWDEDCVPEVTEILSHRTAWLIEDMLYTVKFAAPYDHDIWNREVRESDMKKDALFLEYKEKHNLAA